jgi:hypothetical protein
MKQKNQEFQEKMKKNNILNFVLYQYNEIKNNDINDINNMDKKYNLLKSIMNNKIKKKKIKKENTINISDINNAVQDINKKYSINKYKNNNLFSFSTDDINNVFNINNNNLISDNNQNQKRQNSLTCLRNQIKKIDKQKCLSLRKEKINNFNSFNKKINLPLILDKKNRLNNSNYKNQYQLLQKNNITNNTKIAFNKIMNINNNNYLGNTLFGKMSFKPKSIRFKDNPYKEFDYKKVISLFNITRLNSEKKDKI